MKFINVSIVYAEPEKVWCRSIKAKRGTNAKELVEQSGYLDCVDALKGVELEQLDIGVFSNPVDINYLLCEGDRIEIYRPLKADPKEVRRKLALLGKTMGKKRTTD